MDDPVLNRQLDLHKMEYEKCAERYDNIFKAIWTNFSYMAVVSGAILSFSGAKFSTSTTVILACLPLLFWYLASFEPMNRYGDQVVSRLGKIESELNSKYETHLTHFSDFSNRTGKWRAGKWRVRHVVRIAALLLFIVAVICPVLVSKQSPQGKRVEIELSNQSIQVKGSGVGLNNLESLLLQRQIEIWIEDAQGNRKKYSITSQPPSLPPPTTTISDKKGVTK
jgi:hypothetical protein